MPRRTEAGAAPAAQGARTKNRTRPKCVKHSTKQAVGEARSQPELLAGPKHER
jgi:hypothetical protein